MVTATATDAALVLVLGPGAVGAIVTTVIVLRRAREKRRARAAVLPPVPPEPLPGIVRVVDVTELHFRQDVGEVHLR